MVVSEPSASIAAVLVFANISGIGIFARNVMVTVFVNTNEEKVIVLIVEVLISVNMENIEHNVYPVKVPVFVKHIRKLNVEL